MAGGWPEAAELSSSSVGWRARVGRKRQWPAPAQSLPLRAASCPSSHCTASSPSPCNPPPPVPSATVLPPLPVPVPSRLLSHQPLHCLVSQPLASCPISHCTASSPSPFTSRPPPLFHSLSSGVAPSSVQLHPSTVPLHHVTNLPWSSPCLHTWRRNLERHLQMAT